MEFISSYFLTATILIFVSVWLYYKHSHNYWKKKGIPTIEPTIPFGNFGNPFFGRKGLNTAIHRLYKDFRLKGVKIGGFYAGATPLLIAVHPDFIKNVISKDFQHFSSHGSTVNEKEEPLLVHLFNMDGQQWKDMRVKLTPTFTSGKMKMMFQTLLECGKQLEEHLNTHYEKYKLLDIKEVLSCYTTDVIGSCAFGLECNSFKDPNAEFRRFGRKVMAPSIKGTVRRYLNTISPYLVKLLKLSFFDNILQQFFLDVVRNMVYYRRSEKVTRNDFMQILINMEEQAKLQGQRAFTIEQMAAQAFLFFVAGFETTSTTMTFCLYELAHHQDIQDKLRKEINEVLRKHDGNLTYEATMEMKYLDQVINETLRKYPPVPIIPRVCTQRYELANGAIVEKGTKVFVSVFGLHRDEYFFPNPNDFIPDRFSDENKQNIQPFTFLPFGEGPRICIGLRFGVMQTKVGLSLLLKNYKLLPAKGLKYPLEFHKNSFLLVSEGKILLQMDRVLFKQQL